MRYVSLVERYIRCISFGGCILGIHGCMDGYSSSGFVEIFCVCLM